MGKPELLPGGGPNAASLTPGTRDMERATYVFSQAFVTLQCLWLTNKVEPYQATFEYVPNHLQIFSQAKGEKRVRVTGCSLPPAWSPSDSLSGESIHTPSQRLDATVKGQARRKRRLYRDLTSWSMCSIPSPEPVLSVFPNVVLNAIFIRIKIFHWLRNQILLRNNYLFILTYPYLNFFFFPSLI